jgi:hypothetical protein
MERVGLDTLAKVIESQHGGKGAFVRSVRVVKPKGDKNTWDGVVHIFNLTGHPTARRAYAWASPIQGSEAPRYFAVLHQGNVRGPGDAVTAAVAAIKRWG